MSQDTMQSRLFIVSAGLNIGADTIENFLALVECAKNNPTLFPVAAPEEEEGEETTSRPPVERGPKEMEYLSRSGCKWMRAKKGASPEEREAIAEKLLTGMSGAAPTTPETPVVPAVPADDGEPID